MEVATVEKKYIMKFEMRMWERKKTESSFIHSCVSPYIYNTRQVATHNNNVERKHTG